MRSLTVLWLHKPDVDDAAVMPVVEHGLSDAFRDFCHDAFNVRMPLEYPPLKLVTVTTLEELPHALFIDGDCRKGLTEGGDDTCLFLVDDCIFSDRLGGLPLKDWLKAYIPAIPRVVVTYPGHAAGDEERERLTMCLAALRPQDFNVLHQRFINAGPGSPECFILQKQTGAREITALEK